MTYINDLLLNVMARVEGIKPRNEEGAAMAEYGLLLALIAVVAAGGATVVGTNAKTLFNDVAGKLTSGG